MLRITTSRNADAAVQYFNKALSKQDYYADEKNVSGKWKGLSAQRLGLSGEVTKEQFESLAKNRVPHSEEKITSQDGEASKEISENPGNPIPETGEKLTPKDGGRTGYDFTFNAPKSISIAHAVNNDENLLKAHREAVRRAMLEVEKDMQTQRRGENNLTTGNAVYAEYEHGLSRPVEQTMKDGSKAYIPDPHVHSHCFLFNATWCEENQRFQAVEIGNIKNDAPYYEAVYHATFRQEVMKAGYEVERTKERWELKMVSRDTIEKFSNRTREINEVAAEKGIATDRQKDQLGARTRHNKNKSATEDEVRQNWNERLTLSEQYNLKTAAGRPPVLAGEKKNEGVEPLTPERAVDLSLRHFLENKSSVPEKRVLGEALNKGNFTPGQIREAYEKREDIIGYHQNTRRIITTRETLDAEKQMIAWAASQKDRFKPLNPDYQPARKHLNEGQRTAIAHALCSQDGVMVISGGAGVGKTTLLQEVRDGLAKGDKQLFAFAPSAAASRDVLRSKDFRDADTIKKLLDDPELQKKLNGQVILIDEAGMVGVKTMNGIFDVAKAQNARIILSGDVNQHGAVEAGDALKLLQDRSGLGQARVSQVVRQQDDGYRQAIEKLSDGNLAEGFKRLDDMGAVKEIENREERHEQIARDYLASLEAPAVREGKKLRERTALVVSPTHQEGQAVTDIIRAKLRESGKLGERDRMAEILCPLHYTGSQKQDPAMYEENMVVRIHYNIKGFKAGTQCEIVGKDVEGNVLVNRPGEEKPVALPLDQFEKFAMYQKGKAGFTEGDEIQATANIKSVEGNQLSNGNKYRLQGFTEEGDLRLSNGATVSRNERFIKHGYYATSMSSQGKDADDILIAQSSESFPASSQKQFYVSASRGVRTCRIYTDSRAELHDVVARNDGNRESATEVTEKAAKEDFERSWELATREVDQYNQKHYDKGGHERESTVADTFHEHGFGFIGEGSAGTASPGAAAQ